MGKSVDLEKMKAVRAAVVKFSSDVSGYIGQMKQILADCHDNLDNDIVTDQAKGDLAECIKLISRATKDADALAKKINAKVVALEEASVLKKKET